MDKSKMISSLVLAVGFTLGVVGVSLVAAQEGYYVYDNFDDGVIDTDLWYVFGSVSEYGGKIVISPQGGIDALKENLIGMWFSVVGYQDIDVGEHVNIHLATQTPAGDIVIVGEYINIEPPDEPGDPPFIQNYVFCQWYEDGIIDKEHLHHVDLQPAQWGVSYKFGLEYTAEGSILVWVNGQVVYSFSVPGADIGYSQGGARFWFRSGPVEGGDVTAEIDWAKDKIKPQRCVGAEGSQCASPVRRNRDGSYTGTVSVGSILHDNCCIINYPDGHSCNNGGPDQSVCKAEWDKAVSNSNLPFIGTGRGWKVKRGWGPYVEGQGDDITKVPARKSEPQAEYETLTTSRLTAPPGTKLDDTDEDFCQSKRFRKIRRGYGICF